ncbi:MAG: hypothetical protein M1835_007513 [Candelina submexicana]|nr:MAG: hypothetical protein M1835_007513 [Candelina submexicana]
MGTISMNAVHFYDPSSKVPSFSARCAAALQKHPDEDDDFPSLKYVLHPTQRSEDSIGTPTNFSLIAQETDKTSLPNGSGFSMPTQLSLPGYLDGSKAPDDQSLKGQDSRQDDGFISCQMLEQPSCPALILSDDEDYETQKCQQQQELGEDGEQGACGSDTSSNGDADDEDNHLQDNNGSEGLQSIKQHQLSPSYNPVIRPSRKRRLQHIDRGVSTTRPAQQQHQEIAEEKEQEGYNSNHDHSDDQDSDDSSGPRPAKRCRMSPSSDNLTTKPSREQHLQ